MSKPLLFRLDCHNPDTASGDSTTAGHLRSDGFTVGGRQDPCGYRESSEGSWPEPFLALHRADRRSAVATETSTLRNRSMRRWQSPQHPDRVCEVALALC